MSVSFQSQGSNKFQNLLKQDQSISVFFLFSLLFSLTRQHSNRFQMCLILSAFLVFPFSSSSSSPSCVFLSLPSSFRHLTVSRCVSIQSLSLCQFFCSSSSLVAFIFSSSFFFLLLHFNHCSLSLSLSLTLLVRLCRWSLIYPSKVHTHSSEHTHTPGTPWQPFLLQRPGSSWGFGILLKGTLS